MQNKARYATSQQKNRIFKLSKFQILSQTLITGLLSNTYKKYLITKNSNTR